MAVVATRGAEKQVASIQRAQKNRAIKDLGHAKEVAGQLKELTVTIRAKSAGDAGRLFGSVTAADVVKAVQAAGGPALDRRAVDVPQIKNVGTHQVTVRLHPEVTAEVDVEVAST
jgi:large subunit ribosomal protein L9